MNKLTGKQACQQAVVLLEEQLGALARLMPLQHAKGEASDGVVGVGAVKNAPPAPTGMGTVSGVPAAAGIAPAANASQGGLHKTLVSNALLAIGVYLKEHDMSTLRTPEIQFLGHVRNAIINRNVFDLEEGNLPLASFDGLVLNSSLNGTLLFSDDDTGFMTCAQGTALLEWTLQHLQGVQQLVSGGDAG